MSTAKAAGYPLCCEEHFERAFIAFILLMVTGMDAGTSAFATVPGILTVPAATYTQDPATGVYTAEPGEAVLVVTGTIQTN